MGKTLTDKILGSHIIDGEYIKGEEIGIKIDQTLTQDATGTMAYLQFEAMGIKDILTDISVSYVDHNTIQVGFENADDHRYLQTFAEKFGLYYSRAGNGICHQVHLERFAVPGKTLLGSDSHTPMAGGIGAFAMGAGGLDVAVAMGGGPFYMTCPKVLHVELEGKLKPFVSTKDIILKMLELKSTKGNVGWVVEYGGSGIEALTVPERAVITNMGAEMGVTTSLFPSDAETRNFMKAQGRGDQWKGLKADNNADYDEKITIDLSKLVPMIALPHSPGNVKTVREIKGKPVDQVMIGSCTNSSYMDLIDVANMLEGKKIHKDVSFGIAPGSRQVLQMVTEAGATRTFLDAGARLLETACGFCIGNSMSPKSDAVSLRTNNRNFKGRSGTATANVYLVSPVTAAAAAITGKITDPRDLKIKFKKTAMPRTYLVDDSMITVPLGKAQRQRIKVVKGPNIKELPEFRPVPEMIRGTITQKVGNEITTDHIMPAGKYLKLRSNVPEYAKHVFEPVDPQFHERAIAVRDKGESSIIVAGLSYGQGSSREHAALCPSYLGVKVVMAKSIERIHKANLINFGILPLDFKSDEDYNMFGQGDRLEIDKIRTRLGRGRPMLVKNLTKGKEAELTYELSERQRNILLAGGLLSYTRYRTGSHN